MPTESINLRGSYSRQRVDKGVVSETTVWSGIADRHTNSRPDRTRRPKPAGWVNPTPYSMSSRTERCPVGQYAARITSNSFYKYDGVLITALGNFDEMNPIPTNGLKERAEIDALLALKNQHVNLGVAFAEAQQTANLVGTTAKRIGRAYTSFRKGKFKDGMNHLGATSHKKVPQHWLEAQYAWKPLLSDVKGSIDALNQLPPHHWITTAKGTARQFDNLDLFLEQTFMNRRAKGKRLSGAFVRLDYKPGNTFLSSLSQVGMTNPFEVVWEKVPFSFVVDWFLPVGDWFSAMDATLGWEFKSGSCSILRRVNLGITAGYPVNNFLGGRFTGSYKFVDLNRTVYSSSPLPSPPRFKNPLSLGHMANGLSLLATAFGRK